MFKRESARSARSKATFIVGGAITATLVALTGGPAAAQAPAAASAAECNVSGALCLFDGTDFTGELFTVSSAVPGGTCVSLVDHGWGDRARSAINTNDASAALFANDDCLGGPYQVPAGGSISDLGSFAAKSVWVAD
ncbi:peptidase inhibitor family I36 protein [Streptomyces litchfieldiae]|uniref:Peptidase inhibitor family I36 protein n=1 Tax=Streptomyces litchfieldiae TaxID=3075543 RepID=A0ABU2MVX2_9ACTN|nr:peptidase inhibitor family I36 protein [Streptomyces sp. DSM 44938]MDT0345783.1 peptidase inhibitor family I36 protein [Streptomyces sp. DSM 44938]